MHVDELLALPVGSVIRWDDSGLDHLDGEITKRDTKGLHIQWTNGDCTIADPYAEDLRSFANRTVVVE